MSKNILIVMALEAEAHGKFIDQNIIYTGVGKVNAAYALTKAIAKNRPDIVVNLGSAGSTSFKTGTIVNCTKFIQRDMNAEPLGFDKWVTPFEQNSKSILTYGEKLPNVVEAICGSGDNFDTTKTQDLYNTVDMEAYALAKICHAEQIPFICLKYISDGADSNAAQDWNEALEQISSALFTSYNNILKFLANPEYKRQIA